MLSGIILLCIMFSFIQTDTIPCGIPAFPSLLFQITSIWKEEWTDYPESGGTFIRKLNKPLFGKILIPDKMPSETATYYEQEPLSKYVEQCPSVDG